MLNPDLSRAQWRKSTFSGTDADCIEVADGFPGIVPVRDSKDPYGPALFFSTSAWSEFVSRVKAGEFSIR